MSLSRLFKRKTPPYHSCDTKKAEAPSSSSQTLQQSPKFIKQLSKFELEERRLKGLCFNCDEPFTRGHRCKKLFWLELLDQEDEAAEVAAKTVKEEQPEISLNAIIEVSSMQKMLVKGELGSKSVLALIDSGNTHSFVSKNVI